MHETSGTQLASEKDREAMGTFKGDPYFCIISGGCLGTILLAAGAAAYFLFFHANSSNKNIPSRKS